MKDSRQKLYPAIIAVLIVALGASLLSRWQISIETEPRPVPTAPLPSPTPERSPDPSPTAIAPPTPSPSPTATAPPATDAASRTGSLRVSNRTMHPIRVALLPAESTIYQEPVHWDFAPEEGSDRGLRLSLPERELQVSDGDVLVAFAQDGSRRYWGPYVVGNTNLPSWVAEAQEWQLIFQPE